MRSLMQGVGAFGLAGCALLGCSSATEDGDAEQNAVVESDDDAMTTEDAMSETPGSPTRDAEDAVAMPAAPETSATFSADPGSYPAAGMGSAMSSSVSPSQASGEAGEGGVGGSESPDNPASSQPEPGSGGDGSAGDGLGGTGGVPVMADPVSFAQIEMDVFEPAGCTAGYCHGGGAGDMVWSYESLVGMEAALAVCGLTERVVPGDPESSILWHRVRPAELDGDEPCAGKMPKQGSPLTAEQAQLVYDWIVTGAAP